MIIKIVGFKVGRDKSTCYYKVDIPVQWIHDVLEGHEKDIEAKIGHYMWLALKKSDFVSVRK